MICKRIRTFLNFTGAEITENKKKIIWLIQSNQTTPIIIDYLKTLKTRIERYIDILFWIPDTASDKMKTIKVLNPTILKTTTRIAGRPYQAYLAKRESLSKERLAQGLTIADVLLLDDLGGSNVRRTTLDVDMPEDTCGLILQVPTPLGSSEMEEKNFHSAILWAKQNKIPAIGYELLPLDTKWTLAPSLPDGIITRHNESFEHLKKQLSHDNVWLLPVYEAAIFSSISTDFHLNGAKACYHYKNAHSISADRTILYLPHNVAMVYEYQEMIKILSRLGNRLHLMFGFGKDQVRGAYSQEETIELVCEKELKNFASYSFHDANIPWEMMMADAVIACSACFNTEIIEKELPCIIFDPALPPMTRGNKRRVTTQKTLLKIINQIITAHQCKREFTDILMLLTRLGKNDD